jgi:predicted transcriptional regulator
LNMRCLNEIELVYGLGSVEHMVHQLLMVDIGGTIVDHLHHTLNTLKQYIHHSIK